MAKNVIEPGSHLAPRSGQLIIKKHASDDMERSTTPMRGLGIQRANASVEEFAAIGAATTGQIDVAGLTSELAKATMHGCDLWDSAKVQDYLAELRKQGQAAALEEVFCTIPRTFRFTADPIFSADGKKLAHSFTVLIKDGMHGLPRFIAEHWWCVSNGVKARARSSMAGPDAFVAGLPKDIADGKYDDADYPIKIGKKRFGEQFTAEHERQVRELFSAASGEQVDSA